MKVEFDNRFKELLDEGQRLISSFPGDESGLDYWVPDNRIAEYQRWLNSVVNLINLIDTSNGTFHMACDKVLSNHTL